MPKFSPIISLSSLNGKNGFKILGESAGDRSGFSVSSAGDINGDGFGDLIVGAPYKNGPYEASGTSYIVFGKAFGFSATFLLSALNGKNGFGLRGETESANVGRQVRSAGDVNGDGFDDVIISARQDTLDASYNGVSYVVFGNKAGFSKSMDLAALNGKNGFQINGEQAKDFAGRKVSGAGDFNGDGIDDILVSASGADRHGDAIGAAYVIYGRKSGFAANLDLSKLNSKTGLQINGVTEGGGIGSAMSGAGDINGDGIDDIVIGADSASFNGYQSGSVYVVFGKKSGLAAEFELSDLNGKNGFRFDGRFEEDFLGYSVSAAGDVNGDGYKDVIVGGVDGGPASTNRSSTLVVFGRKTGFDAHVDLSKLTKTQGFEIIGHGDSSLMVSVSSAGDVNGDGYDDILVGSPASGKDALGTAYVIFGKKGNLGTSVDPEKLNGTNGFRIKGTAAYGEVGQAVSSGGDVNGDGFDDLILGSRFHSDSRGTSYVLFGHATGAINRTGTATADILSGGEWNDTFNGLGGKDVIRSGAGKDTIKGGSGNDSITGGAGQDRLYGEAGKDTFVFAKGDTTSSKSTADTIYDFSGTAGDRIDLHLIDANASKSSDQAFTFLGTAAFTKHAGELRYEKLASDTYISGDTNGDGKADFIIHLDDAVTLKADYFIL